MTTAVLYFAMASAATLIADRLLVRISWPARVALVLLPLCFTGRALLTGRVYAPIDLPFGSAPLRDMATSYGVGRGHNGMLSDVYCLNIPWKYAVRVAYANGEWPLWNPFNYCGDILAASAQPTPYEPFFLTSLLLPMANSLTYLAAITFFLGGLLMFVFLRDLGCSEAASLAGAAAWMFSWSLVFWLEWVVTPTVVWFPLVLLGVRRVVWQRSIAAAGILTFAFSIMLLNGHPESALHIVGLGLAWAAFELWQIGGRGFARAAALGVGAGVLALLLTAIFMLPVIEAIPQSYEEFFRENFYSQVRKSVPFSIVFQHLQLHFIPFRFGDPSQNAWTKFPPFDYPTNGYTGSIILPIAALGLWRSRRHEKWVALGFVVIGLLIGNEVAPFADILGKLPLFRVALNTRLIFAFSFGLAFLGALGVDAIGEENRALSILAAVTMILLAGAVAFLWPAMRDWGLTEGFLYGRALMLLVPLILLALVAALWPRATVAAIVFLILTQRTMESADFYPTLPSEIFYPKIALLDRLPKGDVPYRFVGYGQVFYSNMATMYGVEDVRGYQAMTLKPLHDTYFFWCEPQVMWFNRVDDLTKPFLSMMNVRYALARSDSAVPDGWRKIAEQRGFALLENTHVLPRAFTPREVRLGLQPERELLEMYEEQDFSQRAWISVAGLPEWAENGTGQITIVRRGMRRFQLQASMERAGWIVISEAAWNGWRAYIDGHPVRLHRANHAFLSLNAPAGRHTIDLVYWPASFVRGRTVSAATLLALLLVALGRRIVSCA